VKKKYQVFISSTYSDLVNERKAVEETIIRSGDIPVGMEAFPAADDEQFEFIKTVIDSCDYYVLIVAGRYGTQSDDGMSYTEKEFHYAVQKSIPVLLFLHANPGTLAANNSEKSEEGRKKLADFIELASAKRIRKNWENIDALKLAVREAIDHAKATKPRPGWVRGDLIANEDVIRENLSLHAEIAKLRAAQPTASLDLGFEPAGLDAEFLVRGTQKVPVSDGFGGEFGKPQPWSRTIVLKNIFSFVAPNMRGDFIHSRLNNRMAIAALGKAENSLPYAEAASIDTHEFNSLLLQLEALGLISTTRQKTAAGANADFSCLTDLGTRVMSQLRVQAN
jgi:hypothetical protein